MEEWVVPEEQRGQDEIYTVENDYGSISYQFADSVLYVTENIQEQYLVRVEADSILYFSDQMPSEWRPYVGMKLAAGISHMLPYGLNNRVLSVGTTGGFIKVVTTRINLKEVYKHLRYCFDGFASAPDIDSEQVDSIDLEDYGFQMLIDPVTGDTIITDWNDYDISRGTRPAYARRRSLRQTRAKDKLEEEEIGEDNIKSSSLFDISLDSRDLGTYKDTKSYMSAIKKGFVSLVKQAAVAASKSSKNGEVYAALRFKSMHYTQFHALKDEDAGIEDEWTDTWSDWELALEAGYDYKKAGGQMDPEVDGNLGSPIYGFSDMVKSIAGKTGGTFGRAISPVKMQKKRFSYIKVRIPLTTTPVPFAIIFEGSITPTFEFNGSICVSGKYTTDKVRNGSHVVKAKDPKNNVVEKYEDKVIEKGHFTAPTPMVNGSYKVGVRGRVAGGFEVGGAVGMTVGANVEGYFEGNATFKVAMKEGTKYEDGTSKKYLTWYDISGTPFQFYVDIYGDITVFVAPLGIPLWDKQVAKFMTKRIVNEIPETTTGIKYKGGDSSFGAQLGQNYEDSSWDGVGDITGWFVPYNSKSLLAALMGSSKYYPAMKLYVGDIKDNKWIWLRRAGGELYLPSSQWRTIENGESYYFREITNLSILQKIAGKKEFNYAYAVPAFVSFQSDNLLHTDANFDQKVVESEIKELVEFKNEAVMIDMARPNIQTLDAQHLESMDVSGSLDNGTYLSNEGNNPGVQKASKTSQAYVRQYFFYTSVQVTGGSFMKGWGLTVYVLSPKKKRLMKKVIPVNKLRSGRYTFLFSFFSDWVPVETANEEDHIEHLYFRVTPYWEVEAEGERATLQAEDSKSTKNYPIDYFKDNKADYWSQIKKNKGLYGESDNIILTQ